MTALEAILHAIVDHLPVHPAQKDALKTEISAVTGEKGEQENAPE